MKVFNWPIRVYYEDTDSGGVVYHSNYLSFLERARTEWLRDLGVEQDRLIEEHNAIFAVTSVEIAFRKPARFNDLLNVETRIAEQRRVGWSFDQRIVRQADGLELIRATVKVACLDAEKFRPKAIPEFITLEIERDD